MANHAYPFSFRLVKEIEFNTPYGDYINEMESPIFEELGLGSVGTVPAKAFMFMDITHIINALSLYHFAGLSAAESVEASHWVISSPIDNIAVARALYDALRPGETMGEDDTMMALVHKGTRQVIAYSFAVGGDGFSSVFSVEYA